MYYLKVNWIDKEKLATFIYKCQDADDGGIADRPGNMADIFHTFFGISGLSLLGHFRSSVIKSHENPNSINTHYPCLDINPTYDLPQEIVEKYKLNYQILPSV